jgi:hypothetical protein
MKSEIPFQVKSVVTWGGGSCLVLVHACVASKKDLWYYFVLKFLLGTKDPLQIRETKRSKNWEVT